MPLKLIAGKIMPDFDDILNDALDHWKHYIDNDEQNSNDIFGFDKSSDSQKTEAYEYLEILLKDYKGTKIQDVFDGQFIENEFGSYFLVKKQTSCNLQFPDIETTKEKLYNDLKLVYGIKDKREKDLKKAGYHTLNHLTEHKNYGQDAKKVIRLIEKNKVNELWSHLTNRYNSKSAQPALNLIAFFKPEDILIFDIESLGLFHRIIFLFGAAKIANNKLTVYQFIALDYEQEQAALADFVKLYKKSKALVSFNGLSFDKNYIQQRLAYNFMEPLEEKPHFDVLRYARRFWNDLELPDFKLKTLENYLLDIQRQGDVPSDLVPDFYETYINTKNIGPLVPIITHNQQDLISTARLLAKLLEN